MNRVHAAIIKHIRDAAAGKSDPIATQIASLSDDQFVRMMFGNYRGRDQNARGLRLTNFGLQVMKHYFTAYEIAMPEGHTLRIPEILYLDHRATLPYHCTDRQVVVFESDLGVILRLADGDIGALIAMETG